VKQVLTVDGLLRPTGGTWLPVMAPVAAVFFGLAAASLPLGSAVLVIGVLMAALLVMIHPLVGLALALVAGPLGAVETLRYPGLPVTSGQVLLAVVVLAWLGRRVLRRSVLLPHTALNLPLTLFILVAALSLLTATSITLGLKELTKWLEVMLIALVVVDLFTETGESWTERDRQGYNPNWLVAILVLAVLSQALIGVWQFGLAGDGPDHFMILEKYYRAFGTFQQPNPFGGFMSLGASLSLGTALGCLAAIVGRRPAPTEQWFWLALFGLAALVSTLALLFSWSRGAWLGFAAAVAVLALNLPRTRWRGWALIVAAAGLTLLALRFGLLPSSIVSRLGGFGEEMALGDVRGVDITDENYAVIERLAHWQAAVDMAADEPWLGVGFGNYEAAYGRYALVNWPNPLGHAHNYYLNIVAETGILGALAYLGLWAFVLGQSVLLLRRLEWPERGIALGLLAAWTGLSVHHLVDKLYVNNMYIFLGVMLGLQQVLETRYGKPTRRSRRTIWGKP
jgi:putative inorganic carbon (hco3(-)) transporter